MAITEAILVRWRDNLGDFGWLLMTSRIDDLYYVSFIVV